ncbi:MAG: AAA family ATPase [Planctomycetaceae bacterium]|nr:AAA family ATPase [Planctomycetaceae bacterium]
MLSPQSQEVIDILLAGEEVGTAENSINIFDADAQSFLQVLIDNQDKLNELSGARRAELALKKFLEVKEQLKEEATEQAQEVETVEEAEQTSEVKRYRLISISCNSFRGIAPAGEDFEFEFDAKSTLIYGPNGSGKSSLMGAITWALSGTAVTDSGNTSKGSKDASLHKKIDNKQKKGSKATDWPVVATIPDGEIDNTTEPKCSVTLELQSQADQSILRVRRSLERELEACEHADFDDEANWKVVRDLSQFQISALDIQLSVVAPTIFGRSTVEEAESTTKLLGMVLGFDGLAELGKLAGDIGGNCSRLVTTTNQQRDGIEEALNTSLQNALEDIPDTSPEQPRIKEFIADETKEQNVVDEIIESLNQSQVEAEAALAALLGIEIDEESEVSAGLSEALIRELGNLKNDGLKRIFPSLDADLEMQSILKGNEEPQEEVLNARYAEFKAFLAEARERIAQRFEWKKKEDAHTKLPLMRHAAEEFHADENLCPVCDQSLEPVPKVKEELESLQDVESEYLEEPERFFRTLKIELEDTVSNSIRTLADKTPGERLIEDWTDYLENRFPESLNAIATTLEPSFREIVDGFEEVTAASISLYPDDATEDFANSGAAFEQAVKDATSGYAVADWLLKNIETAKQKLAKCLTSTEEEENSLVLKLQAGKQTADEITPVKNTLKHLGQSKQHLEKLEKIDSQLSALADLKTAIERVKELKTYAETEVVNRFTQVSDQTLDNWKKLYKNKVSGLLPCKMVIEKRKADVAVFLTQGDVEVPSVPFANAGLQRSIALCFYFALLEKHPNGLNFIVMDDPILSLDENHRERWSRRLLCPETNDRQSIIATHQEQYAEHCREQFPSDSYFRLIDRKHRNRITCEPTQRLQKAEIKIHAGDKSAAFEMRMFVEEIYLSFESYSPDAFFFGNLTQMTNSYASFSKPHPLASNTQNKIVARLNKQEVTSVTNPGSHKYTQPNVSITMCEDCLEELRTVEGQFKNELKRLSTVRAHALRDASIPSAVIQFSQLPDTAIWSGVQLMKVATAAARNNTWVLEESQGVAVLSVVDGEAIVCATNAIEPVIRFGQWILIAPESELPEDGDLVAVDCVNGDRLVRRIWSSRDDWTLQAINPVEPIPDHTVPKVGSPVRKILGVLYEPLQTTQSSNNNNIIEWQPSNHFNNNVLSSLEGVQVIGESMKPIACPGQHVLIDKDPIANNEIHNGDLVVADTNDEDIGRVIKRFYRTDNGCVLISPNPVDPHAPETMSEEQMQLANFWKVKGVLFEAHEIED